MSASSDHAIDVMNAKDEYLESLQAFITASLPWTRAPNGIFLRVGLRGSLLALEVALLRVQTEVMEQQLANMK